MNAAFFRKPVVVFIVAFVLLFILFYTVPLQLFDGEIIFNNGLTEWKVLTKLSLRQALHIGVDIQDLKDVETYYLVFEGYMLLFLMHLAFPALLAYRFHMLRKKLK